jgi:hypothetical protein
VGWTAEGFAETDYFVNLLLGQCLLNNNRLVLDIEKADISMRSVALYCAHGICERGSHGTYLLLERVPQIQDSVDMHPFPRNAGLALARVWLLFMTVTSTASRTAMSTIHHHSLSVVEFSKFFVAVGVRFGDADVFIDFTLTVSPG